MKSGFLSVVRARVIVAFAAVLGLGFLFLVGIVVRENSLKRQHRYERERIDHWLRSRLERPPPGEDPHTWQNTMSLLINTVGNAPIYYRQYAPVEKVRAVADYLEKTNGADLDSLVGALRLATRIQNIVGPEGGMNGAMVQLREWQATGELPTPPEELRNQPANLEAKPAGQKK